MSSSDSPQLQIVNEFVRGFDEGNVALIAKNLHKDFRRNIYPRSLGIQERTREEWLKNIAAIVGFTTEFATVRHSVVEAPGKVIVHSTSSVKSPTGVDVDRESLYITHICTDEDGSLKIMYLEEFTDSQVYLDLFQAATEAKAREQNAAA